MEFWKIVNQDFAYLTPLIKGEHSKGLKIQVEESCKTSYEWTRLLSNENCKTLESQVHRGLGSVDHPKISYKKVALLWILHVDSKYFTAKSCILHIFVKRMCVYVCMYVCDRCTATPLVPPTPNLARRTISVLGRFKAGESRDSRPQLRPRTLFSLARSAGMAIRLQDVAPSVA